jgi:carbon storage regulator
MLVLTRKSNQSIMIGDNIEVSVLAIMGEKVRIGIQADRTVPVFRKEVYLEIQAEQSVQPAAAEDDGDADNGRREVDAENGRREVDAALRSLGDPE